MNKKILQPVPSFPVTGYSHNINIGDRCLKNISFLLFDMKPLYFYVIGSVGVRSLGKPRITSFNALNLVPVSFGGILFQIKILSVRWLI